jgi:uncharacterized protein (TIGR04255 family)
MAQYIPAIQEAFRRNGYPIEKAGKIQQLLITPSGPQMMEQERWEYWTKDETRSVLVTQDSVSLQTTSYGKFEEFADQLRFVLGTVLTKTESNTLGVIQRIGLRYVDLIRPEAGKDYRFYLKPGFHGLVDEVFEQGTHRLYVQNIGNTKVDGKTGTMIVRVAQSDDGTDLPPDLAFGAPKRDGRSKKGELVTFIDMDHYLEDTISANEELVVEKLYRLHDQLIETFHIHVVTEGAIQSWK